MREAEQDVGSGSASVSHHGVWLGFFVWLWEEQILVSEKPMRPQSTVVLGIAAGERAAFNKQGYGISLGVAKSGLFCWACVTHL